MSVKRTAIIIGSGPAGLSTALRLHQRTDISCKVFELRPKPTTLGGAVGIPSNGMQLAHRLGIHDQLLSCGNSCSNLVIRSIQGSVLGDPDLVGWAREKTGFGYLRIKRTELVDILLEAARKAEIPVHYNKRLTTIEDNANGVKVTFSDGTTETADMLFGCDGIHSYVRKLYVDPTQAPEYSGFASIGSIIPASTLSKSAALMVQGINATLTQEGMFMAMTCTASADQILWGFSEQVLLPGSGDTKDGWEVHGKEEVERFKSNLVGLLESAHGEWGSTMKEIVNQASVINFYPIHRLPLGGIWFKGRCLLLGDAAHAMQPHAGQGVSMALEDAFLISRLLEDQGRSPGDVFAAFERIRRPRVDEIADLAARNAEVRKKSGPWGLWFKELGIRVYMGANAALGLDRRGWGQKHLVYDIDEERL